MNTMNTVNTMNTAPAADAAGAVFIVFIVFIDRPRSSGVPGKCPEAREAGEAPLMGPTGIFWGNQKYLSRRREYGKAERTEVERGPPENAPTAREAGEAPLMGPTGIF